MAFKIDRNLRSALRGPAITAGVLQAAVLLLAFALFLGLALWSLLGPLTVIVVIAAVAAIVAVSIYAAPATVMRFFGAQPHQSGNIVQMQELLIELARRAELPRQPELYVIPSTLVSAFSYGLPERSAIAVTEGLLRRMTMREVAGILAHETSQIRRGNLFVLAIADLVTRAAQVMYYAGLALAALNLWHLVTGDDLVSWWSILLLVLAPALLNTLQLSLPRSSVFDVDRKAALLTGDSLGLASAIARLDASSGSILEDLIPPVPARRVPQPSLLRCPPAAQRRIARLHAFEAPPMPPLDIAEGPRISLVGVGPIEMRPRYRWPGVWF
jgi:heat shock protein HtpX